MKKTTYNPLIHNRKSIRLKGYDYRTSGAYFITLNTENRAPLFGETKDGEMEMNEAGETILEFWNQISVQFPFVELDAFIVMPDHFHGIIIINESTVGARFIAPQQDNESNKGGFSGINNPMFHQNLSRIIRWFKGRTTFEIRKFNQSFKWQGNYYEHIIRDTAAFDNISRYIQDNPKNWRK
jgi:REP element-mobilizing transposase RayT